MYEVGKEAGHSYPPNIVPEFIFPFCQNVILCQVEGKLVHEAKALDQQHQRVYF